MTRSTDRLSSLGSMISKIKKQSIMLLTMLILLPLSGCQTLADTKPKTINFSHYYLWIKSLNNKEVAQEITRQKSNEELGLKTDVQLIMLYSLPNSPIHNPYTAKSMLNDYPLAPYLETTFSTSDLAFIVMLKDQLNQQLLLLAQITNYKGVYQQSKKVNATQLLKINELNQQIIQLKKIEKTISERGQ